jgi:hypothetical protein
MNNSLRAAAVVLLAAALAKAQTAAPFGAVPDSIRVEAAAQKTRVYAAPALPPFLSGAMLPGKRIVTYYGNPLSQRMGILGEFPPKNPGAVPEEMLERLANQAAEWERADPMTPVQPGLELVAVVASNQPGRDGKYRTRMSPELIDKVLSWARSRGWITILDVQVGHSRAEDELAYLRPYLEMPDVHLALDPEFDMQAGVVPGRRIGSTDAPEVNAAIAFLADLVEKNSLPPKLLLVHRFTDKMLTNAPSIRLDSRVQVAIVMDGFGPIPLKRNIYRLEVADEPVEFAGIKLFYNPKNDRPMMTPDEVLKLRPQPSIIIYQ